VLTDEARARREKLVLDHFHDEVEQDWDAVLSTLPHPALRDRADADRA
jgi:hypothetical protein